jgi:beta-glucosidase
VIEFFWSRMKIFRSMFVLLLAIALLCAFWQSGETYLKWDWSGIDTRQIHFPKNFLWGTATAAHQIEGNNQNTNWGAWEHQPGKIRDGSNADIAVDGWNLAIDDIRLMQELGVNAYRFSLAWNKIEPQPGKFNEQALQHYDALIDALLKSGIQPMITLHHVTHPDWFEKKAAFEKEENLQDFVRFAALVFTRYHDRVKYWATINEPNVSVTQGYLAPSPFPPGKDDPELAALVMENMLKAHVLTYRALKAIEQQSAKRSPPTQIGIVTSLFQIEPLRAWHPGDRYLAGVVSALFNDSVLGFFKDGEMRFHLPLAVDRVYTDQSAPATIDFIGINYYSHNAVRFGWDLEKAGQPLPVPGEVMTDMDYTIYPEGLYRAIRDVAGMIKKPIMITENGISDKDDSRRRQFIEQSLYAVSKAIADGYDVRGYFYWSLMDNFEWSDGYTQHFGLYAVDPAHPQQRSLRSGAKAYMEIIRRQP